MQLAVDVYTTLALAAVALVIGRLLVKRVGFLERYSIPDAVVGGMLFAVIVTLLRGAGDIRVEFDPAMLTPLNVMFFTTVGLSADARSLAKGGRMLLVFFAVVVGALLLQNIVGVAFARLFDLHPANGLITGSIALSGGHGTAAAWGTKFVDERNLQGAIELGIAAATYGLVLGGLLGGPLATWLMRRHGIQGSGVAAAGHGNATEAGKPPIAIERVIESLLLIFASMAIGFALYRAIGQGAFTLPTFIWALLVGAILRNVLSITGLYQADDRAIETIGTLSLSLFLAMIITSLKLWELVDLAGPVLVMLLAQTAMLLAYVALITFRVMGSTYDAVMLSVGHYGFAMGSTATAMINVQAIAARHGHSHLAFLLIPVMGAFLIDLANALAIQGFLFLPWFTW
jgi:ESS family glutamate:Na+ symporter